MDRIAFTGNRGLITKQLDNEAHSYVGQSIKWVGLVAVDITFDLPTTEYPADDIPDYIVEQGIPVGTGSITLRGINLRDYTNLISADINSNGTRIRFGGNKPIKRFSFSVNEEDIGNNIIQKHIFWNCRMTTIPDFSSATRLNDSPTLRDITIPITCTPIFYGNESGNKDRAIYDIMTNEDPDFKTFEDDFIFPTELD
jgi:hypothetical protein